MELLHRFKNVMQGKEGTLRERIFCTINVWGCVLAVLGLCESATIGSPGVILFSIGIFFISLVISLVLVLRYHMIDAGSIIVGINLCAIVLPIICFTSGGVEGGSVVWLSINIVYTCLMFEGKIRVAFILGDVLIDVLCYGICYHFSEVVTPMVSREVVYFDSLFSVVMVGLSIGMMIQVYTSVYKQQRDMINRQKEELERAGKAKDYFFASMSHEIRTPINTIIGFNEMIMRENPEGKVNEYGQNIQAAGKILLSLVNDILDVSQLEMKMLKLVEEPYDLSEVIIHVVDTVRLQMEEKHLTLYLDVDDKLPKVMLGDKKRIQQILVNLMMNAVKYTSSGSVTLVARLEKMEEENMTLRLSVQDTGIGIRKEELESLYETFRYQGDQHVDRSKGSGLGLTITKQLVNLMEGEISVDSIYSKGSIFTVLLPQKIVDGAPIGSTENVLRTVMGKPEGYRQSFEAPEARVLVVDDDPMSLSVVTKLLEPTGVQVDIANSGEECLVCTKEHYYHVILMDHLMPKMNGVETLWNLQQQENGLCRDSAVLALTANAGQDARNYYQNEGFDGYLEKPIEGKTLEQYILNFIPDDLVEYREEESGNKNPEELKIRRIRHKRKKRIAVTTDCVADIPADLIEKYGIGIMYLYIRTDKGRFADTREINVDNLSQYLTEHASTAVADSVSVEEYENFFAEQLDQAEEVIHISMAGNSGKSYSVAMKAAEGFDHVHIIDSKHLSGGQGLQVLYAAQLVQSGYMVEHIVHMVREMQEHIESCYIMPSASIFVQNGYSSKYVAEICNLLQLHPIVKMKKGRIGIVGFCTGSMHNARLKFIRKQIRCKWRIDKRVLFVTHVGLSIKQRQMVKAELEKRLPVERTFMERASFSCACNSGMGTFGFSYYTK